jgi:hypothetical protein
MYASATSGDKPNNEQFSECSKANISAVLIAVLSETPVDPQRVLFSPSGGKRNCFSARTSAFCGNQVRAHAAHAHIPYAHRLSNRARSVIVVLRKTTAIVCTTIAVIHTMHSTVVRGVRVSRVHCVRRRKALAAMRGRAHLRYVQCRHTAVSRCVYRHLRWCAAMKTSVTCTKRATVASQSVRIRLPRPVR